MNQITASDGTNIQAGIKTAQSLLDAETAENEIIVLLSDGEPTYSYRVNQATGITYSWKGGFTITDEAEITGVDYEDRVGNGRDYTLSSSNRETYSINNIYSSFPYNHGNTTIYEAGLAKNKGSEVYTIAYQANDTAKEVMKEVATSSNHAYESGNASAAFSAITSEIQNTIYSSQPKVIDEMGSGLAVSNDLSQYSYKFTIIENDPDYPITIKKDGKVVFNNYTINPQNQTIEWMLEDESETFSNGVYTMTYYVQLDSSELGVGTYDSLYTNNDAELTYIDSEGRNQSVKFPSPSLKLEIKGLTVTYTDGVDDIEVFEDQVYENIKSDSLTPMFKGTPEREGYTFIGWSPEVASNVTEDVVYEAQWKANEYTIRYTDGVENEEIFEDQIYEEIEYGTATPTFEGTLEREGYTFAGWSPEVASNVTGDVVYEAQWKANEYTIRYTDGVENEEIFEDQIYEEMEYGTATPTFEGTLEREGYTFVGWSPEVASNVTGDVVYEAQWKANEYTVRYTDGVENEEIFEDQIYEEMEYGTATPTFEGTLEREGYTFAGWSPEVASVVTGDVVYEAQWIKNDEIIEKPSVLPPTEDNDDKKTTGIDVKENASKAVDTGDNTNVGLLMIILFVSVFGITKYTWKKRF
ncbi:putative RNA methylase [Breznakia pachnodae]|uniref:RNA methylase n=1 Tax=Breznakia pachnodae TaxID=265178 RepID=A0ABU0E8Y3_9FIRM|nr:putative RNA methylase [Breznakia pachnodae]